MEWPWICLSPSLSFPQCWCSVKSIVLSRNISEPGCECPEALTDTTVCLIVLSEAASFSTLMRVLCKLWCDAISMHVCWSNSALLILTGFRVYKSLEFQTLVLPFTKCVFFILLSSLRLFQSVEMVIMILIELFFKVLIDRICEVSRRLTPNRHMYTVSSRPILSLPSVDENILLKNHCP